MKKYFFLSLIVIFISSCTQNDIEINDQYNFNGQGGIKCEVDGVLLKPSTSIIYSNVTLTMDEDSNNQKFISLGFTNNNINTGYSFQSIHVTILNADFTNNLTGSIYSLRNGNNNESFGNYIREDFNNPYQTTDIVNGEIKILYHDKQKHKIGGSFWFDAVNENGEIIRVRNGQFDLTA